MMKYISLFLLAISLSMIAVKSEACSKKRYYCLTDDQLAAAMYHTGYNNPKEFLRAYHFHKHRSCPQGLIPYRYVPSDSWF